MDDVIIKAEQVSVIRNNIPLLDAISFELRKGDHLAITGPSGSGKTLLGMAMAGRIFHKGTIGWSPGLSGSIVWIEQQHHFKNRFNTTDLYYQQRFNSYDSEETQTVEESFGETGEDTVQRVLQQMNIDYLRSKPLIQLSNGENKKLQIAKALLQYPSVLIMDQPFTGLDTDTRKYLHQLMDELAKQGVTIVLITTTDEIPVFITKLISLEQGKLQNIQSRQQFLENYVGRKEITKPRVDEKKLRELSEGQTGNFEYAIRMQDVKVQYGEKQVLQHINWEVKKGERWLLSGPNGAGKSTLLSLVTADNPQAYANGVYLFDKKRGSGESIWDIKKRIGFLSPELHLFFDQSCTCFEAIASGLSDTIGLFRQLSGEEMERVSEWMQVGGIIALRQKRLAELSLGEQRIVLLIRALVKNPPLLILDEPCQGIDHKKQAELLELINAVCLLGNKTLVFVTHYSNDRPACIDHLISLDNGMIVEKKILN